MHYSEDKIVRVGEHVIILPPLPTNKKDILFGDKKPIDQFWNRESLIKEYRQIWYDFIPKSSKSDIYTKMFQSATLYDQDNYLVSLNEEDSMYIDGVYIQERNRRVNGVWFFNDGQPTHITGDHYFLLMYARMQRHDGEGQYADYREFQSHDFFYLVNHARTSSNILGGFWSKAKKTGITNCLWSGVYLNRSTLYKNKNLGYMNIDKDQAAKTFGDYYMYSYNGMISPLKPEYKALSMAEGRIMLGKSYSGSKKKPKPNAEDEDDINSSVMCVATKPKAFDVAVMSDIAFDEPTKYKESFSEIWRTNKEAVKIQSKINGSAWLFNYTEGSDTPSFREARKIFYDSELKTIDKDSNGQTISGLICHHIPAYASWEGAFDRHGKCNEKKAYAERATELRKISGDKRATQALIRQYANDKKEAWGSAGAGSTFDPVRMGELRTDLEREMEDSPRNLYLSGHLEWVNPLFEVRNRRRKGQFCAVKQVLLTDEQLSEKKVGKMRFYRVLPPGQQNAGLANSKDEDGLLLPPDRFNFVGGFDPTSYAAGSEVIEGSKNGGYAMSMPNEIGDNRAGIIETGVIYCEYYDRSELPDEAFDDFLKMIIYYGMCVIVEGNASYVATRLLEEGLGNFMFVKDDEGNLVLWKRWMGLSHEEEKKYQIVRITANSAHSKDMLETLVRVIKNYIEKPPPGEKDRGKTIKSERLLEQISNFDPENTRIYDLVMAFGWCLLAKELYVEALLAPSNDFDPSDVWSVMRGLTFRPT